MHNKTLGLLMNLCAVAYGSPLPQSRQSDVQECQSHCEGIFKDITMLCDVTGGTSEMPSATSA